MDDPRAAVHSLTRRSLGPLKPVKAAPAPTSKEMRPEEAFRAILLDCLAQITANAATLRRQDSREARSVEGLHQLRVSLLDTLRHESSLSYKNKNAWAKPPHDATSEP